MADTLMNKTSDYYIELEERFGAHNYHPLDVVIERGEGVWLTDVEGRRYLDCLSAYSAVNQGHCHPRIRQALVNQASRLSLVSRAFRNDQLGRLYARLHELTGYDRVLPMNSGAEAVETAVKAARKWGYQVKGIAPDRAEIIVCRDNFHGRTTTVISFSTEEAYRRDFGPFTPGFKIIPYGKADALEAAITPETAAVLLEPIQGEAGVIVPPDGYLRSVRDICTRHNVLMMADEIQTGLGRTGRLFACDHEEVRPDVMIIGKALSGGFYPISAVLSDDAVLGLFRPGDHGSTFGGNPLAAVVACEALDVLIEEGMIENAARLGEYFQERLAEINSPHIREVRGKGLLIGVVLKHDAGGARRFCEALRDRGILCKETRKHVIRLAPPLVITREEIDWVVTQLAEVLQMP